MIDPKELTDADIGRKVIYQDSGGVSEPEIGVLSSWTDKYVRVRFRGPQGESCDPLDVEFL